MGSHVQESSCHTVNSAMISTSVEIKGSFLGRHPFFHPPLELLGVALAIYHAGDTSAFFGVDCGICEAVRPLARRCTARFQPRRVSFKLGGAFMQPAIEKF